MTQEQNSNRDKTAVDYVLGDKPTDFQLKLLQLGRELDWDENDPGFAVPLAMGQVENVLKAYPAKLQATMDEISKQSEVKWERIQAGLKVSAMRGEQAAQRMDTRLVEVKGLLDLEIVQVQGLMQQERLELQQAISDEQERVQRLMTTEHAAMLNERSQIQLLMARERSQMQQLMASERAAMADEQTQMQQLMADERAAATQQAQVLADQQKQVLEQHTTDLIAQGVIANQRRAESQVKEIINAARGKHYWEAAAIACLTAALLMATSWMTGWVSRGRAENSSVWGDIERWNQDPLQACIDANTTTCNFHIQVPENKD